MVELHKWVGMIRNVKRKKNTVVHRSQGGGAGVAQTGGGCEDECVRWMGHL